jgi:outer membrane protein assembly factor BamD (BamD/ComL family)
MRKYIIYTIILIMTVLSLSCQSVPRGVNQGWSEEMFFKQAQEAIDNSQLSTALFYYEVFLIRFPENHAKVIAAEYERAILHKKLGAEDLAIQGLKKVLENYETSSYVILYPPRYKVLAEKVLAQLEGRPVEDIDPEKYPARKASEEPAR